MEENDSNCEASTYSNQSDILTEKKSNVQYLTLKRNKLESRPFNINKVAKYNPEKYIYLASYSQKTFINNDGLRSLLYQINNEQNQKMKTNLDFLKLNPSKHAQMQKYFVFPQEIVYAHLKNHELKILQDNCIALQETDKDKKAISFVKLYLFEKEFVEPLGK